MAWPRSHSNFEMGLALKPCYPDSQSAFSCLSLGSAQISNLPHLGWERSEGRRSRAGPPKETDFGKGRPALSGTLSGKRRGKSPASNNSAPKLAGNKKRLSPVGPRRGHHSAQEPIIFRYSSCLCQKQSHRRGCGDIRTQLGAWARDSLPLSQKQRLPAWPPERLHCSALCRARGCLGRSVGRGRNAGGSGAASKEPLVPEVLRDRDSSRRLRPRRSPPQPRRLCTRPVTHQDPRSCSAHEKQPRGGRRRQLCAGTCSSSPCLTLPQPPRRGSFRSRKPGSPPLSLRLYH